MAEFEQRAKRYPTDLTNEEWPFIQPFLPAMPKRERKPKTDLRAVSASSATVQAHGGSDQPAVPSPCPSWPMTMSRYGPSSLAWSAQTCSARHGQDLRPDRRYSFYCSCERAFQPSLRRRAIAVLSNNDGCAIARTPEAKALGINMGDPWHLIRRRRELAAVEWFSSNYALYGDMSRRMFQVLAERVPRVEPYSIDEIFLNLAGLPGDLTERCRDLRDDVLRLAKIPTCIGWGPTKTIAKLANGLAKDIPAMGGLCDLTCPTVRAEHYRLLPASEVWGIGGRTAEKLERSNIKTIADFVAMDSRKTRDMLTVVGSRIQVELRGMSSLPLSEWAPTRKGIACTRSFGRPITAWSEMREAVAAYSARAGEKLRAGGLVACHMAVFLQTNPHGQESPGMAARRRDVSNPRVTPWL